MTPTPDESVPDIASTLQIGHTITASRRRRLMFGGAAVAIVAVLIWLFSGDGDEVRYATAKAERGDLAITVTATGTLQPTNQVDVGSELSGTVKTVEVDYNDRVKVGEVLARLDTSNLDSQVIQSESALLTAEAKVREATASQAETRRELARTRDLIARNAASDKD
ncbi:MAG: biotin/lipoyl-binding protein, partial [Rhodocyclaceae bacterium]